MIAPFRSYCRQILVFSGFAALFTGCASVPDVAIKPPLEVPPVFTGLLIEQGPGSLGCEPRRQPVTILVLHHTAGSLPSSLETLQGKDPKHRVGIHYVVTDEAKPRVIRMVPESMAAFHAGKSSWGKLEGLNQHSVGIEIINYDGNVYPYSDAQADIIFALCSEIIRRHDIKPWNVVAHSDIAVGRKIDPGSKFPWAKLAKLGVGAAPLPDELKERLTAARVATPDYFRTLLKDYGYAVGPDETALKLAVEAFQRHFRPSKIDGLIDVECTAILECLVRRYQSPPYRSAEVRP
jgi:N-acetyl-anhydromuramyl-L-alanine amidase AmpD